MITNHVNDILGRRLKRGQTTSKRIQLAAGLNINPISATVAEFIDTQADIKMPVICEPSIKSVGKYVFESQISPECTSRFALVCAETLFSQIPLRLRTRCRHVLTLAYAYMSVPTQRVLADALHRRRERLHQPWHSWLESSESRTEEGRRASQAYCGFGICITAVQENMDVSTGGRFMITDSMQEADWAVCGDEQVFWETMRSDFVPWLIGGPLPVQAATPPLPPKPS